MKKLLKNWWFWVTVVLVVLIIFLFPKSCGGSGGLGGEATRISCDCIGIKVDSLFNRFSFDASTKVCYGICLKNTCERTIIPMFP